MYRSPSLIPPSILLVDDEVDFVETLAKRIAKRDVKVSKAHSGQEAIDKLKESPSMDIVILDVKMPGMDGLETLGVIKNQFPLVEVIMLTGHGSVEDAIEGMRSGAYDYLMKPCEIDLLMAKVDTAVRKKRDQEHKILEARANMLALKKGLD